MIDLVIFDFDGVVVDSELVSNGLLAQVATELGHPMTALEGVAYFGGSTLSQQVEKFNKLAGSYMPKNFGRELHERTLGALSAVKPIEGLGEFLDWLGTKPRCIGSTSALDRIEHCLKATGLTPRFGGNIFSVAMVKRNKPAPDIFLHAAAQMGVAPARVLVIEDSPHGVQAGLAAGMTVVGIAAASHLGSEHMQRLHDAGAHVVVDSYRSLQKILDERSRNRTERVAADDFRAGRPG